MDEKSLSEELRAFTVFPCFSYQELRKRPAVTKRGHKLLAPNEFN